MLRWLGRRGRGRRGQAPRRGLERGEGAEAATGAVVPGLLPHAGTSLARGRVAPSDGGDWNLPRRTNREREQRGRCSPAPVPGLFEEEPRGGAADGGPRWSGGRRNAGERPTAELGGAADGGEDERQSLNLQIAGQTCKVFNVGRFFPQNVHCAMAESCKSGRRE